MTVSKGVDLGMSHLIQTGNLRFSFCSKINFFFFTIKIYKARLILGNFSNDEKQLIKKKVMLKNN